MESVATKEVPVARLPQLLAGEAIVALPETILVVEDEGFVRQVTSELLRESGYRVLSAANATAARLLFMTSANPIALLLCDSVLPGENGLSLARALRRITKAESCICIRLPCAQSVSEGQPKACSPLLAETVFSVNIDRRDTTCAEDQRPIGGCS